MKSKLLIAILTFVAVAGVLLLAVFLVNNGNDLTPSGPGSSGSTMTTTSTDNPIVRENKLTGTSNWQIPTNRASSTQIQAFAGATYVLPGKQIQFYVSTLNTGTHYSVDIYRMGWYGGMGARLMTTIPDTSGVSQGNFQAISDAQSQLVCASCTTDTKTGLLETHWKPTNTLPIPSDWTTGVYLAKFTDAQGWQTYTPFDVLGNSNATYLLSTPDTTAAAYNNWGGSSLYDVDDQAKQGPGSVPLSPGAGVAAVTFDKPYIADNGAGLVLTFELPTIRWLERQGYDVSYISTLNLQENPNVLMSHKAYLSIGHDEYWTKEIRDGLESARDHGIGMAFLGANTGYWQMRFGPDSAGVPNRTIICYKVQTVNKDLQRDPLYGKDNTRVTAQWRDPVVGRPEEELTGVMFVDLTHVQAGFTWHVDPKANSPLLKGTGLQPGQDYGCGIVGYEWDNVWNDAHTPKGIHILSTSPVVPDDRGPNPPQQVGNSAYYVAPSGALVFGAGSIYFQTSLDNYRDPDAYYQRRLANACAGNASQSVAVPEMQKLMTNIMDALIVHHSGDL